MMKPKPTKLAAPETPPQLGQGEQQPRGDANASANTDARTGDVLPASGEPMKTDKSEARPSAS
ncbi:rRNA adenine N(6)-methyltransferase [Psidium guajava]|nr:rRNA adenine N(6)-methyltransferase [Psidium guajava]